MSVRSRRKGRHESLLPNKGQMVFDGLLFNDPPFMGLADR